MIIYPKKPNNRDLLDDTPYLSFTYEHIFFYQNILYKIK